MEAIRIIMKDIIAAKDLIGRRPDGATVAIKIRVGRPYRLERYQWAVSLSLEGIRRELPDVRGVDSFEALSRAFALLYGLLEEFVGQGGALLEADGETPFDLEFPVDLRIMGERG